MLGRPYIYFRELEASQRLYLRDDRPVVIRLDGKDVTKDKETYDLVPADGIRAAIHTGGIKTARYYIGRSRTETKSPVIIFSVMDETSVIFTDAKMLLSSFDDGNAVYIAGIFLQKFTEAAGEAYEGKLPLFGISVFNLNAVSETGSYTDLRRVCGRKSAAVYLAKKYGRPDMYKNAAGYRDIENNILNDKDLCPLFKQTDPSFTEGRLTII